MEAHQLEEGADVTKNENHGSYGTYVSGCRCDDCRRASEEVDRQFRREFNRSAWR